MEGTWGKNNLESEGMQILGGDFNALMCPFEKWGGRDSL